MEWPFMLGYNYVLLQCYAHGLHFTSNIFQ